MKIKVIALRKINKTLPGGEFEVAANQARALVMLGKAKYADESSVAKRERVKAPAVRRRRTAPKSGPVGAVTKQDVASITQPIE